LGRARGKISWNPPEALPQAIEVAEIRAGRRTPPETITFTLFARGREIITLNVLRRAYAIVFDKLDKVLGSPAAQNDDERFARAEALTPAFAKASRRGQVGRQLARRLRREDPHIAAALQSVHTWILLVLSGADLTGIEQSDTVADTAAPLDELRTATGLKAATEERIGDNGPLVPNESEHSAEIRRVLDAISVATIHDTALNADLHSLAWGRDAVQTLVDFGTAWASVLARANGSADAMGLALVADVTLDELTLAILAPLMVLLRGRLPGLEAGIADLRPRVAQWQACSCLLDRLPSRLHRCLGADFEHLQAELPAEDRALLRSEIGAVERDEPEMWAQLTNST
jgi:hypothetical protein